MMKKLTAVLTAFFLLFVQMGCKEADRIYFEKSGRGTEFVTEDSNAGGSLERQDTEGTSVEQNSSDRADTLDEFATAEAEQCYVYVCGAVKHPGVYVLKEGSRIYEALELAGGLTEDASLESVNQAETVSDGQMVRILTKEEVSSGITMDVAGVDTEDTKVNLNTASDVELMTLPGIGQSKADSIIAYRETKGSFSGIEEIMNVEGIKEGVFNRIKDYIRVK